MPVLRIACRNGLNVEYGQVINFIFLFSMSQQTKGLKIGNIYSCGKPFINMCKDDYLLAPGGD